LKRNKELTKAKRFMRKSSDGIAAAAGCGSPSQKILLGRIVGTARLGSPY